MRNLVLGGIVALALYEFIALLTRVRSTDLHEEARLMRLRRLASQGDTQCE